MSHHHYQVLGPSVRCSAGASLAHGELQRYGKGIVEAQMMEIDEMRRLLCERYSDCRFQPFQLHHTRDGTPMNGSPNMFD